MTNHTLHTPQASIESKSSQLDPLDGIGRGETKLTEKGSFYVSHAPPKESKSNNFFGDLLCGTKYSWKMGSQIVLSTTIPFLKMPQKREKQTKCLMAIQKLFMVRQSLGIFMTIAEESRFENRLRALFSTLCDLWVFVVAKFIQAKRNSFTKYSIRFQLFNG